MATDVGDILGGAIHFAAFFVAARLDSKAVITDVGEAIMHDDVAAGIGVQGVGVRGVPRIDDFAVTDVDMLAVEQMDGPEGELMKLGPSMRTS